MAVSIPLDTMSVEEKLQTMEALWDDLRNRAETMASPSWHGEILADREAEVERGTERFENWEIAKGKLKNGIA